MIYHAFAVIVKNYARFKDLLAHRSAFDIYSWVGDRNTMDVVQCVCVEKVRGLKVVVNILVLEQKVSSNNGEKMSAK